MDRNPPCHPREQPTHGKPPLCRAHRASWVTLGIAVLVIAVASVAAWHVVSLQQAGKPMPSWVDMLRSIGPGDFCARRSGLDVMASVYSSIVVLTFPLGVVMGYGFLTYRPDGSLCTWGAAARYERHSGLMV